MDRLKSALGGGQEQDDGVAVLSGENLSADNVCGSLSWGTRLRGFAGCLILGLILSLAGSICVFFGAYATFAVLFTVGNILSLTSTCFLMGPLNQLRKMFSLTRLVATGVVLVMIILTLLAGLLWHNGGLSLLFSLLQYLALAWYSISYIPFARDAVTKCVQSCIA